MSFSTSVLRFSEYYRRYGFGATIARAAVTARRKLFSSRNVLFYCDLHTWTPAAGLSNFLKVERKRSEREINPGDLEDLVSVWSPKLVRRNIKERFGNGASLWLIKSDGKLAGYGWTLQGKTVEPHYFRLGHEDVHLFDFHVLSRYRGRGFNPLLVTHILRCLKADGGGRAFIEAAGWNRAQLSSLRTTPFCHLGLAREFTILGHTMVCWCKEHRALPSEAVPERLVSRHNKTPGTAGSEARRDRWQAGQRGSCASQFRVA